MRSMLLSFGYEWYDSLKDGRKIYEHRKRFCDEEVTAYVYVGKPLQKIVAIITLGRREKLEDWLQKYKNNSKTYDRIIEFMQRNKYGMKVIDFQEIEPIDLADYIKDNPKFIVPRSYYWLDKNLSLYEYIQAHKKLVGEKRINIFPENLSEIICRY